MTSILRAVATLTALSITLSACSTLERSETLGTVAGVLLIGGGAAVAVADHGATATVLAGLGGAILGGAGGKRVARSVFQRDLAARDVAYRRAMGQYVQSGWNNPDTQSYGRVARTSVAWRQEDEVCARFKEDYSPQGQALPTASTTACLSARGWRTAA